VLNEKVHVLVFIDYDKDTFTSDR